MSDIQLDTAGDIESQFALPKVGEVLADRYVVKRRLGQGGMGVVFEAVHQEIERSFAVKFLRTERALTARGLERFKREARLLAKLRHEGIVNIVDTGTYRGSAPYIVLEHVDGWPLSSLISQWSELSLFEKLQRSLRIMSQLCSAMKHAHELGILHRDLKPDNVLVTGQGDALRTHLVDFGIGIALDADGPRLTPSNGELGTPHYMSPEQAKGDRAVGARSDVYALGVLFYQLLTGKLPHPGDSYNAVVFHILTQPVLDLREAEPRCPSAVSNVVMRCLALEPKDRFADAGELLDAISRLTRELEAVTPVLAQPTGLTLGRFSMLAAAAVIACLVVAATQFALKQPALPSSNVVALQTAPDSVSPVVTSIRASERAEAPTEIVKVTDSSKTLSPLPSVEARSSLPASKSGFGAGSGLSVKALSTSHSARAVLDRAHEAKADSVARARATSSNSSAQADGLPLDTKNPYAR